MIVREIRVITRSGEKYESEPYEFEAVNTMADARQTRRLIGWKETRLPERDVDGFVFWQFDFWKNGANTIDERVIIGYKEAILDTP